MAIRCLLSLCMLFNVSLAESAQPSHRAASGPTRFYCMNSTFWDNGPAWDYHILEARQDGPDTLVRDILIISVQTPCGPSCTVKAKTKRVPNTSPAELSGDNNPCAVDSRELRREIRWSKQPLKHTLIFSSADFGIAATCGGNETVLHLPLLPFAAGPHGSPGVRRSYDLLGDVETRVFGTGEVFKLAADTKVIETFEGDQGLVDDEKAGAVLVGELRSGAFDRALWDDCKKPACAGQGLKKVLETYILPQDRVEPAVSWIDGPGDACLKCALPAYPPIGKMARIEGDVEIEIRVDEQTGLVVATQATRGHPLLLRPAIHAAQAWQFQPQPHLEGIRTSRVKLRFSLNCWATRSPTAAR